MEDRESVQILIGMLEKYPLNADEREALRGAIGVMGWTKLVDGWKERKKEARRRREGLE